MERRAGTLAVIGPTNGCEEVYKPRSAWAGRFLVSSHHELSSQSTALFVGFLFFVCIWQCPWR